MSNKEPTIRELFQDLSTGEQAEAEELLARYVEIVLEITERVANELKGYAQLPVLNRSKGVVGWRDKGRTITSLDRTLTIQLRHCRPSLNGRYLLSCCRS